MKILTLILLVGYCSGIVEAQEGAFIEQVLKFRSNNINAAQLDELYYKAEASSRDYGLYLRSSLQHRFGEGIIQEDLSLANLQTYYKAGIEWNILKNGWLSNVNETKRYEVELELERIELALVNAKKSYQAQIALVEFLFNNKINDQLLFRKDYLGSKRRLFQDLRRRGYVTGNQWSEFESREKEVSLYSEILEESIFTFEQVFSDELSSYLPPILNERVGVPTIDVGSIIDAIDQSSTLQNILRLEQELVDKPFSWNEKISISANLTYNYQTSFSDTRRDFTSAGLSIRIPLANQSISQKAGYEASKARLESAYESDMHDRKRAFLSLYNEYNNNRKILIELQNTYQIISEKQSNNYLERTSVNTRMPINDVSLFDDDKMSNLISQLEIKKQLYKVLIKIDLLLIDGSVSQFLSYPVERDFLTEGEQQ